MELPSCVHRGPANADGRYPCDNAVQMLIPPNGVPASTCMVCPYHKESIPEGFWDKLPSRRVPGPQAPIIVPRKFASCKHFGESVGEVECSSCRGTVMLKTFSCGKHGTCTAEANLPNIAGCNAGKAGPACQDYEERT